MTIAVSVLVRPSRILAYLFLLFVLLINVVLLSVVYSIVANVFVISLFSLTAGAGSVLLLLKFHRSQKECRLHVSNSGQIILHSTQSLHEPQIVVLSKSSTLWQQMMLLHLRAVDGSLYTIVVLPDSVEVNAFRGLLVAMHYMSKHVSGDNVSSEKMHSGNF